MLKPAYETTNPWSKPLSTATKQATSAVTQEPFVKQYTFHIDPRKPDPEHVLMTTTSTYPPAAIVEKVSVKPANPSLNTTMEEKPVENTAIKSANGSPRSVSPGGSTKPAVRGLEDIWNQTSPTTAHPVPDRRRNELSSDDEVDESAGIGNGESKAGFISRRPSMTAELETRIRQVRLSEGSDLDRHSGPSSPSASAKWNVFGMNWNSPSANILGGNAERKTPPQDQNVPISPLARFQQFPFDPPAPRQVSPSVPNPSTQGYTPSRARFPPAPQQQSPPAGGDQTQRAQRSQSFSVGDHTGGFGAVNYLPGQTAQLGIRNTLFEENQGPSVVGARHYKASGYPASPLARAPIAEEVDDFDASIRNAASSSKENSPSRYQDRGRSLSTSAASHGYAARQRLGESEDVIDEALYEEDEEAALQDFEPLSRSRTLPAESSSLSSPMTGLGFSGTSRFSALSTDRERLQQQRGARQSPRIIEDIPSATRRQDSYSQAAWEESRAVRSPPRPVDYPGMSSGYDSFESTSVDSPGSIHSFPGMRDYSLTNTDVQNYFNNDADRRRLAAEQFQYYQMQSRYRHPMTYAPQTTATDVQQRPFSYHDPDQYTLHFVKFKANRMDVFYLAKEKKLDLKVKDYVIVDGDRGTDLGMVCKVAVTEQEARALTAQLQREQAAATAANQNGMNANAMEAITAAASGVQERDVTIPKKYIHRLAVKGEIDGLQMKMQDEAQAKQVCEMKVQQRGLQMDILDVEYQWDRRKLYIYFIAPQRVDFVALVKDLFKIYKTRIWLHNSTASHVTSQLAAQNLLSPTTGTTQGSSPQDVHEYTFQPLQPQYDYYRPQQRASPGQQQYFPMHNQPMYSAPMSGGYFSPPQQQYYPPAPRTYVPPPPPPPVPPQSQQQPPPQGHTSAYQSPAQPPLPPGHWEPRI